MFAYSIIYRMRLPMRVWSLLLMVIYAPFSYKYPISIMPFINMTSILEGLLIISIAKDYSKFKLPGLFCVRMMVLWMVCITLVYMVTLISVRMFGGLYDTLPEYKKWLEPYMLGLYAFSVLREEHLAAVKATILFITSLVIWHTVFEGMDMGLKDRIGGVFLQPNQMAAFISYYSPFLLLGIVHFRWVLKPYFLVSMFSAILGILYTQSRAGALGILVGAIMTSFSSRKTFILFPVFLLSFGMISLSFPDILQKMTERVESTVVNEQSIPSDLGMDEKLEISAATRIVIWNGALRMIYDHPLGVGFEQFKNRMLEYCRLPIPYDTHNFYLRVGTEFGILCFLVFIVMLISLTSESISFFKARLQTEPLLAVGMVICLTVIWLQNFFGTRFIDLGLVGPMWIGIAAENSMKKSVITSNKELA